jgi:hypothetical protein
MKQQANRRDIHTEKKTDRKPLLVRLEFLTITTQKQIDNQPRSRSIATASTGGGIWEACEQGVWCGRAEYQLDDNTQFL